MSYGAMARAEVEAIKSGWNCERGCTGKWHLTQTDVWVACGCGDPGEHPEAAESRWEEERQQKAIQVYRERYRKAANVLLEKGWTKAQINAVANFDNTTLRHFMQLEEKYGNPVPFDASWAAARAKALEVLVENVNRT